MNSEKVKIGISKIIRSSSSVRIKAVKFLDFCLGRCLATVLPSIRMRPILSPMTRLLIIRPGGMGDAIFLLPILKHIRRADPALTIDILCEKRNAEVFRSQPQLARHIYRYDDLKEFCAIFSNRYDVIIDTEQWHYFSAIVAYFIKSELKVGFTTRPLRTKLYSKHIAYGADTYELVNFKSLFIDFWGGIEHLQDINSCYEVSAQSKEWASKQTPSQTISVFLGASIPERRLTHEQSLALIKSLLEKKLTVALLGGKDVQASSRAIEHEINDPRVKNFVGKISLEQSAALVQQSCLFIGTDSGLMHLACAVGTQTIAIFGPGNLKKWGPRGERHSIITENVECSPCTRFGYTVPTCHGSYHCMRKLNLNKIFDLKLHDVI